MKVNANPEVVKIQKKKNKGKKYLPKYDEYPPEMKKAIENFLVNLGSILEKVVRFRNPKLFKKDTYIILIHFHSIEKQSIAGIL